MNLEEAKKILAEYNQEHLWKSYERLDENGKENLLGQIERIDFEKMKDLYALSQAKVEMKDAVIEPMAYQDSAKLTSDEKVEIIALGEEAIKSNKLAIVTMAGGQGTRLGHDGPKGTYDLGLDSHKSLFEIQCDILKNAQSISFLQ